MSYLSIGTINQTCLILGDHSFKEIVDIVDGSEAPAAIFVTDSVLGSTVEETVVGAVLVVGAFIAVKECLVGAAADAVVGESVLPTSALRIAALVIIDGIGS